jgi:hypothetical protein
MSKQNETEKTAGGVYPVNEKAAIDSPIRTVTSADGDSTLDEESYRRVPGHIPLTAWLVSFVAIGERWSYYSFLGPLRTYCTHHSELAPSSPMHPSSNYISPNLEAYRRVSMSKPYPAVILIAMLQRITFKMRPTILSAPAPSVLVRARLLYSSIFSSS